MYIYVIYMHIYDWCIYIYIYIIGINIYTTFYCTMEHYSIITKSEIIPFAITGMDLEIIILSEISQEEKKNTILCHLYVDSKIRHK